jgi:catechol 2,3-dioxygenase-like lactoylglutathione lyase family enzyme
MLLQVQPVLPCRNVTDTIRFYEEKLGFALAFQDADQPRYAAVRRDGVELHLQWHDAAEWERGDRPQFRFLVSDVDELFQELLQRGALKKGAIIRDTPWGTRDVALYDPNRNGLTFYVDR